MAPLGCWAVGYRHSIAFAPRDDLHALSAGPVKTRAASGIDRFDELLDSVCERTPANRRITIDQIGRVAVFLASEAGAPLTGSITYADQGFHVIA